MSLPQLGAPRLMYWIQFVVLQYLLAEQSYVVRDSHMYRTFCLTTL